MFFVFSSTIANVIYNLIIFILSLCFLYAIASMCMVTGTVLVLQFPDPDVKRDTEDFRTVLPIK